VVKEMEAERRRKRENARKEERRKKGKIKLTAIFRAFRAPVWANFMIMPVLVRMVSQRGPAMCLDKNLRLAQRNK